MRYINNSPWPIKNVEVWEVNTLVIVVKVILTKCFCDFIKYFSQ